MSHREIINLIICYIKDVAFQDDKSRIFYFVLLFLEISIQEYLPNSNFEKSWLTSDKKTENLSRTIHDWQILEHKDTKALTNCGNETREIPLLMGTQSLTSAR